MKVMVSINEFCEVWEKAHKHLYIAEPDDKIPTAFKNKEEADNWGEVTFNFIIDILEGLGIKILDEFQSAILEE